MSSRDEQLPSAITSKDDMIKSVNHIYWQEVAYRTALECVVEKLKVEAGKCVQATPSS